MPEETFTAFVPLNFFEKAGADPSTRYRFSGFVTTEHKDREGDIALQNGLEFDEFMEHGFFNDNHSKQTGGTIGYPLTLEKRTTPDGKKGTWVEGHLIAGYEPAMGIFNLGQALARDPSSKRKLGFSVEGTIQQRGGFNNKIITKAIVRNVAITANPVNPHTCMNLAKALMAGGAVEAPPASPGEGFPLRAESLATKKSKKKRRKKERMDKAIRHRLGIDPDGPAGIRLRALATKLGGR
jgi:hypothetical protein